MDVERYVKDGKVAVLVSPGYGAGWSTWEGKKLAYDKRVVEFWLQYKDDEVFPEEAAKKLFYEWGYEDVFFGGFNQIKIVWLEPGTKFRITEYDGFESIETDDSVDWCVA